MGSCISKKESKQSFSSPEKPAAVEEVRVEGKVSTFASSVQVEKDKKKLEVEQVKDAKGEGDKQVLVKKEIFVIKHRKSYQEDDKETITTPDVSATSGPAVVRTSSCTREEVDAILIQCGRLSRSSSASGVKPPPAASSGSRKYSGSKRSYDFDNGQDNDGRLFDESSKPSNEFESNGSTLKTKNRQSRSVSPSSGSHGGGRRRTPSRERESGSGGGTRERRASRSPTPNGQRNRRSETPTQQQQPQPGKMVSVPAAVISTSNSTNNNSSEAMPIRRVAVKRNVMSPRSQSPAKGRVTNPNGPSLSRNGSRKTDQSPNRRNPLNEIDTNAQQQHQSSIKNASQAQVVGLKPSREEDVETGNSNCRSAISKGPVVNNTNKGVVANAQSVKEEEQHHHQNAQQSRSSKTEASIVVVGGGADALKPPETLTRSRSARRSRDFDVNVDEPVPVAASSYNTILLRDIQNFHQKSHNSTPSFSLPACVAKACSILDAVADLNSTTSSNLMCSEDGNKIKNNNNVLSFLPRKGSEAKDPFVESVLAVENDITEPSLHKYVTMRRCAASLADEQESSGSNSFVGWDSSSWEPNSADSTDCWSSRSNTTREEHLSPLGFQRHTPVLQRGIDK